MQLTTLVKNLNKNEIVGKKQKWMTTIIESSIVIKYIEDVTMAQAWQV